MKRNPEFLVAQALEMLAAGERRSLEGKRILVAVSGGADSVALLCILHGLAAAYGFSLAAVTVNHRIRSEEESGGDAAHVASLCASLAPPVPCSVAGLAPGEVASAARARGGGLEEAARALRYRKIGETADAWGADWIMTAHNRNDNLETILMRVLQGAPGGAAGGIRRRRGRYVRPLLDASHADLVGWLSQRGISWREDRTNADDAYLRNRIRLHLVPLLDERFPGWDTGVLSFADKAIMDDDFCRRAVRTSWRRTGGGIACPADEFASMHPALAFRFLRSGLEMLECGHRVPSGYLMRIVRESAAGAQATGPGPVVVSGSALRFCRRGNDFFWGPDIEQNTKSGYSLYIMECGVYSVPYGNIAVTERSGRYWVDDRIGPVSLPLVIRSRVSGDTVRTADGKRKTLKKLMNDWSVPERDRGLVPVIETDGIIRAVYGSTLGYPDWVVQV